MTEKKKVAILGSGMGSLSAAFWLTNEPDWQEKYDVTIYQMGWRLGGKAASSRNGAAWQRNEEHGYHMLFGFYENTFATMRACYKELGRSPNSPLSEFCADVAGDEERYPERYAMKRNSLLFLAQQFNGQSHIVDVKFPTNDLVPGDGASIHLWTSLRQGWDWLWWFERKRHESASPPEGILDRLQVWLEGIDEALESVGINVHELKHETRALHRTSESLYAAGKLIDKLPASTKDHIENDYSAVYRIIIRLVRGYLENLWDDLKETVDADWNSYRTWVLADLFGTIMIGVLADDLISNGFDSINHLNYYEWLRTHATVPEGTELTVASVLVQFAYDACFAYAEGDAVSPPTREKPLTGQPNMEAGTLLRGEIRLLTTYKGSVDWLFQAGAGEVLIAPMYEVLSRRGVRFKFFHKVTRLVVPEGATSIESVEMERQVTLNVGEYQPLVIVKGVPAWPVEPLYDQIVEARELQARQVNLECFWTDWKGAAITLVKGRDYDDLILGIPVGSFPYIAQDLCAASPAWKLMAENLKTVRTLGFQTWMNSTLEQTGWRNGKILTDTCVQPTNMEADATQIIVRENWPPDQAPVNLTYFGGLMKDDPNQPSAPNPAYPPTQQEVIRQEAITFLSQHAGIYWPDAVTPEGFRWDWLVDLKNPERIGSERINAQFWKANIDPSERYVLSVVNSTQYRLATDQSGFDNLYLAGDWIKTGLNCGCMEATVMSGMQAARALGGYKGSVAGEIDFDLGKNNKLDLMDIL
jgi:uncharacterized protein with NAD-binding domain and iron-sulfur cluster